MADHEISGAGSDYMSYTKLGYPAAFASEGNPLSGGKFPGDYDPYVHGVNDTMDIDDETGVFSLDVSSCSLSSSLVCSDTHISWQHMARFSELAIAFVVEQAGWDNKWR